MAEWYVVQVLSSHEPRAKKAIEENRSRCGMLDLIEEVLVPTENVSEMKRGEKKITEKRLWPGYILVKMVLNDETWSYIKDSSAVIGFLGGEKPNPLSDQEVGTILDELQDKKDRVVEKHNIEVGDRIKITDGVFVNFIGFVSEVFPDKGRLSAMVSIFGRDTRVDDLEFWQVEKAPEGSDEE